MKREKEIVPEQKTGKAIEAHASRTLDSEDAAKNFFMIVKSRLERVNHWHKIATGISAGFLHLDATGNALHRAPEKGDYFRIDIPGPGSRDGQGFDWVQVEEVLDSQGNEADVYGLRVRPAANPLNGSTGAAHFYAPESTSTFLVTRKGSIVSAEIFDRNTKPNDKADSVVDTVRAAVVGSAGLLGFSKLQWKGLAEGLVKK